MAKDLISSITTYKTKVVRSDGSQDEVQEVNIVNEHTIEVYVNEQLVARLVCTPSNLEELVLGRLITEGLIDSPNDIDILSICDTGNRAKVYLKENCNIKLKNTIATEPTCCTANKIFMERVQENKVTTSQQPDEAGNASEENKVTTSQQPDEVSNASEENEVTASQKTNAAGKNSEADESNTDREQHVHFEKEWIFNLASAFMNETKIHKSTNGTHSCLLAVKDQIIWGVEDIGRHNSIDKAIGYAFKNEYSIEDCILFTSGRVSTDMVNKAVKAGLPILVSKSVPTKQAVEIALHNRITLICKTWPDSYEQYT